MAVNKVSVAYKNQSDRRLITVLEDFSRAINGLIDETSVGSSASGGHLTKVGASGTPDYLSSEYFTRTSGDHIIIKNSYTAGTGLSGGGVLNASRTFSLSHLGLESLSDPGADRIFFWDESEDASKWLTVSTGLQISTTNLTTKDSEIDHDQLLNFASNEHFLQTDIAYISTALSTGLVKVTTGTGALSVITDASANWNTAYGWGDHAGLYDATGTAAGLVGAHESTYNHSNYNTAYGWGNHALAGYLTSVTVHNLLSSTHDAENTGGHGEGSLILGDGDQWVELAGGTEGQCLVMDDETAYWGDHGDIAGLSDDDHTQYLLADGTRCLTGNWMHNIVDIGIWGDGASCSFWATSAGDSAVYGGFFCGRHCRGSKESPTACASGDRLGGFLGQGYDYDSWVTAASIEFYVTGTIADTRLPGEIRFYTCTDAAPTVKTERMRINNAGIITIPDGTLSLAAKNISTTSKARAYANANQLNIPDTTWTVLNIDTENYDPGSNYNTGTYRFVAPVTGYYLVAGACMWGGVLVDTKPYYVGVAVGGAIQAYSMLNANGTGSMQVQITAIVYVTANDYIDLQCYHNSGISTEDIGSGTAATYMTVHLLSI